MQTRVYIDTSVISCLDAPQTPERMIHTELFWETVKRGEYEIVISNVTLDEINACPEPKRSFMRIKLAEIPFITRVNETDEAIRLAGLYINKGGLPPASKNDALHLAIATIEKCNCIVTWNLKHIVNIRAKKAVTYVNSSEKYNDLEIWIPSGLIIDEETT